MYNFIVEMCGKLVWEEVYGDILKIINFRFGIFCVLFICIVGGLFFEVVVKNIDLVCVDEVFDDI